jgi:hypothetical protein
MKIMKYAFNTWAYSSFPAWLPAYTLDEAIRRLAGIGYDGVEIGCAAPHAWPAYLSRALPPDRRPAFNERIVYTDYLLLALPANHALAKQSLVRLESVAGEPFVLFHRIGAPNVFDEITALCRRAGFSPQVTVEPSLLSTVITLVESGLGVSLVPGCAQSLSQKNVAFRPLAKRSRPIPLCVAWPRAIDSPALQVFLEVLHSQEPTIKKEMEDPEFRRKQIASLSPKQKRF